MMAEEKYFLSIKADEINDVLVRASTKPVGAQTGNFPVFSSGRDLADSGKNTSSYALALKTTDGPSGSVDIYPDEGSDIVVTVHGRTEQEGSGNPSPTNIRPIKSAGIWDNLFDPSLLISSIKYDPQTNTVSFDSLGTETDTHYDWLNGTLGSSALAGKTIQLSPNTRYEISIDNLSGSGLSVYTVDSDGKAIKDGRLYFPGGKNLVGYITTTETGKITIRSSYANKGTTATNLKIFENWFDSSLLYSDVGYDGGSNTVTPPTIDTTERYYDIFNGSLGISATASKTIQLKANTKYGIVCDKISGASLFVFLVSTAGSTFSRSVACSVGEDGRIQMFETTENSKVTLRVYSVKAKTSFSGIRIFELSNPGFKTIISSSGNGQQNFVARIQSPLLEGDSFVTKQDDGNSAEIHNWSMLTFTGDESWTIQNAAEYPNLLRFRLDFMVADTNDMKSSHAVRKTGGATAGAFYIVTGGSSLYVNPTGGQWGDILTGWTEDTLAEKWKAWLKGQYDSGAPLQVAIRRSTPQIIKKDPVSITNLADQSGKVTVSGSDDISVTYNKSLVHAFSELQSAIIALGAGMQGGL